MMLIFSSSSSELSVVNSSSSSTSSARVGGLLNEVDLGRTRLALAEQTVGFLSWKLTWNESGYRSKSLYKVDLAIIMQTWKLEEDLTKPTLPTRQSLGPRQISVGFSGDARPWFKKKLSQVLIWGIRVLPCSKWRRWCFLVRLPFHNEEFRLEMCACKYIHPNWC